MTARGRAVLTVVILALLGAAVYVAVARPFTGQTRMTADLDHYLNRAQSGSPDAASRFFSLLERFKKAEGEKAASDYSVRMHAVVDSQFKDLLKKIRSGDVQLFQEAKQWAASLPDAGQRDAYEQAARKALADALKKSVTQSVESTVEKARGFFRRIVDYVRSKIEARRQQHLQDAPAK